MTGSMRTYLPYLAALALLSIPACDDSADPAMDEGQSSGAVDDDHDHGDTDDNGDTDVDPSTGEAPADCSCFSPDAQGQLPIDSGCFDPLEVFIGCEPAAVDCGAFPGSFGAYDLEPTPEAIEALQCTLDAMAAGDAPAFRQTSLDDMYGGHSELIPLPDGRYGDYYCNTTNETSQSVETLLAPEPEAAAACSDAWQGATDADSYDAAVDCLQEAMADDEATALVACE